MLVAQTPFLHRYIGTAISVDGKVVNVNLQWNRDTVVGQTLYVFTNADVLECAGGSRVVYVTAWEEPARVLHRTAGADS